MSPIIIFTYNRASHLKNLIKSLKKNNINPKTKIYLFCDGPKIKSDYFKIKKIKKVILLSKIKFYKITFRKKNFGLAKNIITGVTEVLKSNKQCIVLEDDLVINKSTIEFMNFFLDKFINNTKYGSVSAYSYLDNYTKDKLYNYYETIRHSSWCWGTWARVWNKINWDGIEYRSHFSNKKEIQKFEKGGNDLNLLLWGNYKKFINSWAIRFNYFCCKKNLISFQPRYSMIRNEGRDMSGTHESISFKKKNKYDFEPNFKIIKNISLETLSGKKINEYIKNTHRKSIKLSIRYFLENFSIL